jgi:plastocyanin
MKDKLARLGISILFPTLFLIGCASPGKKSKGSGTEAKQQTYKSDTVTISMMKFNPGLLKVNKGDTVTWINKGLVPHTVKSYQDNKFYSDTLAPGKTWRWVVTDTAAYFCTIHQSAMKAKLVLN